MSRRSGGVLVLLVSLLVLATACSPGRGNDDGASQTPASKSTSKSTGKATDKSTAPSTGSGHRRDPNAKPSADAAQASPGGFTVRYLKDGKVTQVDVPDFER